MTLVAVDLQRIFADPASPWAAPRFEAAVANCRRLLDAAGEDAVLTRFAAADEPAGAWIDYYRQWAFALVPDDDPLYALTVPQRSARVLTAPTFGKWGAELAAMVRGELVLCGVSTDCCVLSTALAAADAGVVVRVVTDACAGASDVDHERALAAMSLYAPLITLTTTERALAELRASA